MSVAGVERLVSPKRLICNKSSAQYRPRVIRLMSCRSVKEHMICLAIARAFSSQVPLNPIGPIPELTEVS